MKIILALLFPLTLTSVHSQQLIFVKDSVMNNYMKSGYSNKHFRPQGKEDTNRLRQGRWSDYEVANDFAYIINNGKPKQVFGQFLLFGEGEFVDNKKDGVWKIYLIEDKSFKKILQKQVSFVNGKEHGAFTYFFPSGKIGIIGNFVSGELEGEVKSYYENGNLYGTRLYQHGSKTGRHTYLYPDGKVELEHNFTKDTLNGLYQTYYPSGKVQESFMYKMGQADGVYRYYYDNGQLWVEKEYLNGQLMNITGSFDRKGNNRDKGTLKDGNGTVNYYTEEGKIYSVETFKDGKKINEETN